MRITVSTVSQIFAALSALLEEINALSQQPTPPVVTPTTSSPSTPVTSKLIDEVSTEEK